MIVTDKALEYEYAEWTRGIKRSPIRDVLALATRAEIISFAGGLPAPEFFPIEEYQEALQTVLANDGQRALQYGPTYPSLIEAIIDLMYHRGINVKAEEILITTGAQQALNILATLYLDKESPVMVEETIYTGARQAMESRQPTYITLPTDEEGLQVISIAERINLGIEAKFLYTVPEGHNPLGVSMTIRRRSQLMHHVQQVGLPIIEDDAYGFLTYDRIPRPPLKALDLPQKPLVIYLGSFSKILAPALRLGWVVAPPHVIEKLRVIKETADLESSQLTQRAVAHLYHTGMLWDHVDQIKSIYRQRRDAMLAALSVYFPTCAKWVIPQAGMFVWVTFPNRLNTQKLLQKSIQEIQVAYIPGSAFNLAGRSQNAVRLNFSNAKVEEIEEGIKRLGALFRNEIAC